MSRAWCLIREQPHYRRQAFTSGLQAAGYTLKGGFPGPGVERDDVLVIWNRYAHYELAANEFEARGGRVVVAENGYLGAAGTTPKFDVAAGDIRPGHYYALALHGHNGSGEWPTDDGSRWRALGIELLPWRTPLEVDAYAVASPRSLCPPLTGHVLVCPQRGIGPNRQAQPQIWPQEIVGRIRRHTQRPVRIRPHPGLGPGTVQLADDLRDCWAVVTWASGAGIHALIAGVPVFIEARHWILEDAALRELSVIEGPPLCAREPAFERLACAQWTVQEIESGEAFDRLLKR